MSGGAGMSAEEALHFELLVRRLVEFGTRYGDLPAHDGLWESAEATADDLLARLAVVPLALEECRAVKDALPFPIASGERLYTLEEFERLIALDACGTKPARHRTLLLRPDGESAQCRGNLGLQVFEALIEIIQSWHQATCLKMQWAIYSSSLISWG